MSADSQKFYLTTPIYYVNARPHIGHAYTTIVADVLARRHRLLGDETFFLTGTDEHGQKIERSAAAAGVPPQQFTDQVAAEFKTLWDRMGITYDKFIRTTDPEHARGVQKLWCELESRGFIYLDSYTGSYCVSDEAFVDAPVGMPCPDCGRLLEEVTEENYFFKLSPFQKPLLDLIESKKLIIENDARRNEVLSFLRGNVLAFVGDNLPFISNESLREFADRTYAAVKEGDANPTVGKLVAEGKLKHTEESYYIPGALKDLSVSRSSFKWGIPVPEDPKHVIYVWLDALANYITAIGYGSDNPQDKAQLEKFWPADLHLVGKEIIRFHCIYWPAFLLALNPEYRSEREDKRIIDVKNIAKGPLHFQTSKTDIYELSAEQHATWAREFLPKQITAHGWLLFDNSKMSKSKGNIVRTETILDAFGDDVYGKQFPDSTNAERDLFASDVLRYFLLREIPFGQDGSFSFDALLTRYNADLANGYGNLVSRTLNLIAQNLGSTIVEAKRPWLCDPGKSWANRPQIMTPEEAMGGTDFIIGAIGAFELVEEMQMDGLNSLTTISTKIRWVDGYLSWNKPWHLAKSSEATDRAKLEEVLYTAAESIRIITALLYPVMPYATSRVWKQLGFEKSIEQAAADGELKNLQWGGLAAGTKLGPLSPIFPRADKSLIEIMTNMENETTTPAPAAEATPAPVPAAAPAPAPVAPTTSEISIDDFAKIELRVAQIVVAERIPKADKLLRLEVDLGPDFPRRQILSGIAEHYTPEELIGRRIVVITNLAPRKMRGLESHGMLLAASHGENGKPILATFAEDIALGSRLK